MTELLTQATEDYLKAIYTIGSQQGRVSTNALANWLEVSPASTTSMIKRLAELKLVVHKPYQGVELTEAGRRAALEVIRHHRLVELYLVEKLGMPRDQAHAHAESWEHALSEELEARIDTVLGHPAIDPYGAPIPSPSGEIASSELIRLTDLEPGQSASVAEICDHNPELVRYCDALGLFPGTTITLIDVAPVNGPLTIRVRNQNHIIGKKVADQVFIRS